MKYRKVNNIAEIYQDGKLCVDNFSGLDLSNIDLSELPLELSTNLEVSNAKLNNTNLHIVMNSYPIWVENAHIQGTRLELQRLFNNGNSGVHFVNTFFDSEQIEYLNKINQEYPTFINYDLKTLLNNSNLKASTSNFIYALRTYLNNSLITKGELMTKNEMSDVVECIERLINNNGNSAIKTIYDNVKSQMTDYEKIEMFRFPLIKDKKFHDFTITGEIYNCLRRFNISGCTLENVVFDISTDKLFSHSDIYGDLIFNIKDAQNIIMPNINFSDWNNVSEQRISQTMFTFRNNLYLEFGRECNANCSFCRNKCMDKQSYKLSKIKRNLLKIAPKLDYIVIGGGEPTLRKKDLSKLFELYDQESFDFKARLNLFTNATSHLLDFIDNYFVVRNLGYNVSRHSADDDINAAVFGLDKNEFLTWEQLRKLNRLTLACTCIRGATDSVDKIIEYIKKAEYYGIENVMFSNLHDDASIKFQESNIKNASVSIDNRILNEAIRLIKEQGYISSYPIISSGGYELIVLKPPYRNRTEISFKRYLSKEELELLWPNAIKRTFDLSMAPDGTIYENWSETGQKVKILK